jgi:hypothetical protein
VTGSKARYDGRSEEDEGNQTEHLKRVELRETEIKLAYEFANGLVNRVTLEGESKRKRERE